MVDTANTTETINFAYPYPDAPATETTTVKFTISLDEPKNFGLYGVKDKNKFIYGEVAYVIAEIEETLVYGNTPTQASYSVVTNTIENYSVYFTGNTLLDSGEEELRISRTWNDITWEKATTTTATGVHLYGWKQINTLQTEEGVFNVSYVKISSPTNTPPTPTQIDYTFSIELNQSAIKSKYQIEKSDFYYTETAYLKVLPSKTDVPYSLLTGVNGLALFTSTGIESYTEEVTFTNTDTASLKFLPQGAVSSVWTVGSAGVTTSGKNVTLSKKTIGILQCTYSIEVDYYELTYKGNTSLQSTTIGVVSDYSASIPTGSNSASITVAFKKKDYVPPPTVVPPTTNPNTPVYSSTDLLFELDKEYIMSFYGTDKSNFDFKETAFLRIIPPKSDVPYSLTSSESIVTLLNADCLFDYEEDISFTSENEGTLKYFPSGNVTTKWKSGTSFPVVVSGKLLTVQNPALSVGILNCKYQIKYDRIKLVYKASGGVVENAEAIALADYTATIPDASVDCNVSFENMTLVLGENDVELVIKDIWTDNAVVGASVVITPRIGGGSLSSTTNYTGSVLFRKLPIGDVYDVLITHPNYVSSDGDYLNNDFFTVPA